MKYNIPARTLRDWMKRLNIKSVFTHNHSSSSSTSSPSSQIQDNTDATTATSDVAALAKNSVSVTTVPVSAGQAAAIAIKDSTKLMSTLTNDGGRNMAKAVHKSGKNVEGCDNVIIAHKGGRINSKIFLLI